MDKYYRLTGMILLFLLLTNVVRASGSPTVGAGVADAIQATLAPVRERPSLGALRASSPSSGSGIESVDLPAARPEEAPLDPELARAIADAGAGEMVRVLVRFERPSAVQPARFDHAEGPSARAEFVASLQRVAEESQAPVRAYLEQRRAEGGVASYRPFWIVNAIAVRAQPAVIRDLASRRSVKAVTLDHWRRWVDGVGPVTTPVASSDEAVEWNVSRIRADEVWSSLHISGTGAVVAGMDTGVDWLHPALQQSYRGYNPHGPSNHLTNWYDATDAGALYPVDGHGHGSHTMGTMVGREGIGVAPGASWIGVRVLNSQGYGYDSWIHAGFEWVLAPGGDASLAPDVVNCSWGSSNGYLTTFQDDLRALRTAGVLPVFSNGNEGPGEATVGSPASLPEAFAVGAVDEYDVVATFSSRGPSPWGEVRPHVAAPGVHVRSSVPGGAYASMNGTSMAAPHASGVFALLRSVSPSVTITRATTVITSTTMPLGEDVPSNDTGWGRIDAFSAVVALAQPGFITGSVEASGTGASIEGAAITADSHGGETSAQTRTDAEGVYSMALAPGVYDLQASAFGYDPKTVWGVRVVTDTTTTENFSLVGQPTGALDVSVVEASSLEPLTATITVLDTPHEAVAQRHTFHLPAGSYTVRAWRLGSRVVTSTATVVAGGASDMELALPAAPSLLLVDSGGWYYQSEIDYFRRALDDLSYAYNEWPIRQLSKDIPAVSDLTPYDIVVWSAPRDAPGYIGASDVITGYLETGGRMLLSGQDVGFWDGGGSGISWSPYYRSYLKMQLVEDNAPTRTLDGVEGDIFAGTTITIAGAGGADNQDYPDVVSVVDTDAAAPVLGYRDDGCGGVRVGTCLDYRVLYLSFGFEGINDREARRAVMGQAVDWLSAPPPAVGLEIEPQAHLEIGSPGGIVTHTWRVRHIGQGGGDDEVGLTLEGATWPTELSHSSLRLSPCASATVTISVTLPSTAAWDVRDTVTLTARSSVSPSVAVSATLTSKVPAPVLLVDDDRWYDQQETYTAAMDGAGLAYDLWDTGSRARGGQGAGPSLDVLRRYPVVVWWTGYDWYAPVTTEEAGNLAGYLDGGGRLLLSSQDFLYYHGETAFSRDHLGVLTYTEDITPTEVMGVPGNLVGGGLGPWTLSYPRGYQNWSDGLQPAPGTGVAFRDQGSEATALTHRADGEATVFFGFPFEALPVTARPVSMEQGVGWLSWLGASTFAVDPGSARAGDIVSYTITLRHDGPEAVTVSMSNPVPGALALKLDTLVGPGHYDRRTKELSWHGTVEPGQSVMFGYQAQVLPNSNPGDVLVNPARISVKDHAIAFSRSAEIGVERADLSTSSLACEPAVVRPGGSVTCSMSLFNTGAAEATPAGAVVRPPGALVPAPGTISVSRGAAEWEPEAGAIRWTGPLPVGGEARLAFELELPPEPLRRTLYGVAFLDDGAGGRWERPTWVRVRPWEAYLPLVMKEGR